jgi:hypothetical protein
MAELGPVAQRCLDVEHRRLADEHIPPEGDRTGLDHTGVGSVAGEERVFTDDRALADAQQVGAHRHSPGQDRHVPPDLRAQRPQIQHIKRRTDEQDQRVGPDQRLDGPEAHVRQAPDADLLGLPPTHEHPLRHDRKGAQTQEARAAEQHRPQVDVDQT